MKTSSFLTTLLVAATLLACNKPATESQDSQAQSETAALSGQSGVKDDESQKNVVQVAIGSPDHKTLVTALKAAEYVDVLTNAGPFTVFAPTDAAFSQLPAGTIESLLKPENKTKLRDILEYHVYVGVIRESMMQNGMSLNEVNGKNVKIVKEGDKIKVNDATIIATVPTSNGVIYVIDKVLLPG